MNTGHEQLWGNQYPFERNHLQRTMTLIGLGSFFAVTVILLIHTNVKDVLGITLVCGGVLCACAALSRYRYAREARTGFAILATRGGGFVVGSALAFAAIGALVVVLIVVD